MKIKLKFYHQWSQELVYTNCWRATWCGIQSHNGIMYVTVATEQPNFSAAAGCCEMLIVATYSIVFWWYSPCRCNGCCCQNGWWRLTKCSLLAMLRSPNAYSTCFYGGRELKFCFNRERYVWHGLKRVHCWLSHNIHQHSVSNWSAALTGLFGGSNTHCRVWSPAHDSHLARSAPNKLPVDHSRSAAWLALSCIRRPLL